MHSFLTLCDLGSCVACAILTLLVATNLAASSCRRVHGRCRYLLAASPRKPWRHLSRQRPDASARRDRNPQRSRSELVPSAAVCESAVSKQFQWRVRSIRRPGSGVHDRLGRAGEASRRKGLARLPLFRHVGRPRPPMEAGRMAIADNARAPAEGVRLHQGKRSNPSRRRA